MVTARSVFGALRVRPHRAGPAKVLWLAALLLGLLYTHGVSGETAAGHVSPAPVSFAAEASDHDGEQGAPVRDTVHRGASGGESDVAAHPAGHAGSHPGEHGGGHAGSHPGEECLSAQPEQGPQVPAPCLAPLQAVPSAPPHHAIGMTGPARAVAESPPPERASTVLRI